MTGKYPDWVASGPEEERIAEQTDREIAKYNEAIQGEAMIRAGQESRYQHDGCICVGGIGPHGPCIGHGPGPSCPYCIKSLTVIACSKPEVCAGGGEHTWDGPEYVAEDGCMSSVTCSRCGAVAAYHDMRTGP